MARPKFNITDLRQIGWKHWDPLDLKDIEALIRAHAKWPDDEYDTYLLKAAGDLWNGKTEQAVADYLIHVEVDQMGLLATPTSREQAARVASAIGEYVQALRTRTVD